MRTKNIIDIHTHILPGIDDGCRNLEESLTLVRACIAQGITAAIATPHYRNGAFMGGSDKLYDRYLSLCEAIQKEDLNFKVYLGQELHYTEDLPELLEKGRCLPLAHSHYVMIEFASEAPYEQIYRGMREIVQSGYTPILAHMERCIFLDGDLAKTGTKHARVDELKKLGCKMQMSYDSLYYESGKFINKLFDKEVRRCRDLIANGYIDVLGTDSHSPSFRPPKILPALKWLEEEITEDEIARITQINPKNILGDNKLI